MSAEKSWEKTVEYFFVRNLLEVSTDASPLAGNEEKDFGDLLLRENGISFKLIEFKRSIGSIEDEFDKYRVPKEKLRNYKSQGFRKSIVTIFPEFNYYASALGHYLIYGNFDDASNKEKLSISNYAELDTETLLSQFIGDEYSSLLSYFPRLTRYYQDALNSIVDEKFVGSIRGVQRFFQFGDDLHNQPLDLHLNHTLACASTHSFLYYLAFLKIIRSDDGGGGGIVLASVGDSSRVSILDLDEMLDFSFDYCLENKVNLITQETLEMLEEYRQEELEAKEKKEAQKKSYKSMTATMTVGGGPR